MLALLSPLTPNMPLFYPPNYTTGTDANRPAASATTVGMKYYATDTQVTYLCVSSSKWTCLTGAGEDLVAMGTFSDSNYLSAVTTAVEPSGGTSTTFCICFYANSLPSGAAAIMQHGDNSSRGWQIEYGRNAGARGQMSMFWYGLNSAAALQLTSADFTSSTGAIHALALAVLGDKSVHYSFDGAAATTVAALAGTYAAPQSSDAFYLGRPQGAGASAANSDLISFKHWTGALSDSDLQALSNIATTGRIGDGSSGTVTFDFNAARYVEGVSHLRTVRGSAASRFTVNGTLDKVYRGT